MKLVIDCPNCSPVSGIHISMTCPVCERPFRNVRSLSIEEIRGRIIIDVSIKPDLIESEEEYLKIISRKTK